MTQQNRPLVSLVSMVPAWLITVTFFNAERVKVSLFKGNVVLFSNGFPANPATGIGNHALLLPLKLFLESVSDWHGGHKAYPLLHLSGPIQPPQTGYVP